VAEKAAQFYRKYQMKTTRTQAGKSGPPDLPPISGENEPLRRQEKAGHPIYRPYPTKTNPGADRKKRVTRFIAHIR
jgi:hypothetical protein